MTMNLDDFRKRKGREKIVMLTAYDFPMARILDEAGIDLILVGDSLGMVIQGDKDTKSVTMENMLYHTQLVARGVKKTPIIGDMPIHSDKTIEEAVKNAKRFCKVGAHGVKIEGNKGEVINTLLKDEIPVMGHLGLLPQTAESYRVKGKQPEDAQRIYKDALELDKLGIFALVLECIPEGLTKSITEAVRCPTIGIGAGKYCDGQVLVINDMIGMDESFYPKYLKKHANLNKIIKEAVQTFRKEVKKGIYPDKDHTYH